jgi:hypothetical protein
MDRISLIIYLNTLIDKIDFAKMQGKLKRIKSKHRKNSIQLTTTEYSHASCGANAPLCFQ